ncbi:MAG: Rne/Rng family ribonuclease [Terriglobia bacterium]
MTKELLISSFPHETKVAVLEDDQLVEVYFQRDIDSGLVGGIYKGKVNRVLPGMQSAFVDIGLDRDAFLYVSDFFEDSEEYDRVFTEEENRVARISGAAAAFLATPAPEPSRAEAGPATSPEGPTAANELSPVAAEPMPEEAAPEMAADRRETPASSAPKEGTGEDPKRDFHGRRNRRRGRGFRENRFEPRREASEKPREFRSEGPSKPLELLPGESLAKYGGGAVEGSRDQSSPTAESTLAEEPRAQQTSENAESAQAEGAMPTLPAMKARPEIVANTSVGAPLAAPSSRFQAQPQSDEADTVEGGAAGPDAETAGRPGVREGSFEDVLAVAEQEFDKRIEPANAEVVEVFAEDETLTDSAPSDADRETSDEFTEFPRGGTAGETEPVRSGEEAAATAPVETTADETLAGTPPGQTYTLRDSHQRPRVAPRRGRKGGRPFRGHQGRRPETEGAERSRAGNHQPLPINELLKEGQEILVQIAKEPLGTKGARITSHIALPGRYLVYMPTITHIGVSRKIGSDEERLRLRNILLENRGSLTGGFIVRTAGAGRSEEELKADVSFLTHLWDDIRTRAERSKAPALLHRDLTLVERILRDLLSPDFKCVRVDNENEYEHVLDFVHRFQPALIGQVKLYTRDTPLFEEFGVQAEIDKALKPKVWLKSGGYIVINQTEALVAIDVNTGKYVGKTNRLEDTIVKTNIDAVIEIVRQIRLRDLGGIIVIDFIDMDERRNRTKVVQALEDALRYDRAPTKILSFNEFGLVALTRKRAKQSLERTLCEPCPYCTGAGWVKSAATVSNEIVAEARKMASQIDGKLITLRVNPQVAAALKAKAGAMISEIESAAQKEVVIKSDPAVHQERYEIF